MLVITSCFVASAAAVAATDIATVATTCATFHRLFDSATLHPSILEPNLLK